MPSDSSAVEAAQDEAAGKKNKRRLVTIEWDGSEWGVEGEQWEIPPKVSLGFYNAQRDPDPTAVLMNLLGSQYRRLGIDDTWDMDELIDLRESLMDVVGEVWGVGNGNRSSRRSKGTTKR